VLAKVSVHQSAKEIKVDELIAVCDAGLLINPDGVIAQIEGGMVQSASRTL